MTVSITFHYDPDQVSDKPTIMHLDDEFIALKVLQVCLLKTLDVNLISVSTSSEALVLLREEPGRVDVLIQDHIRPEMNGLQLLTLLRADKQLRQLPVIFLTDGFPGDECETVKALGAQVVIKPMVDAQTLLDSIATACAGIGKKLTYLERL